MTAFQNTNDWMFGEFVQRSGIRPVPAHNQNAGRSASKWAGYNSITTDREWRLPVWAVPFDRKTFSPHPTDKFHFPSRAVQGANKLSRPRNIVIGIVGLLAIGIVVFVNQPAPVQISSVPKTAKVEAISAKPTLVGREVCRECHAENYHLHADSGHASTFISTRDSKIAMEKFVGKTFDSGEPYGTYTYKSSDEGLVALLPEKFGDDPFPLEYAVGSGHVGVTFLSLLPDEQDGTIGIEHRVSWFSTTDQMNLTPGHVGKVPENGAEFFGDPHRGKRLHDCVFCHTTSGTIVDQKIVDLIPNVNCEKCHGPGSEHVRLARISNNPPPFSVGRDDWTTESELKLCGRCHRMPKEISPKELRKYGNLLLRFQPIGLLRSECYLESDGQFMCTTCHNPHTKSVAPSRAAHVKICVDCHLTDSSAHVACPVSPKEGCIECHMPAIELEHGIKFHDHWIRVREDE